MDAGSGIDAYRFGFHGEELVPNLVESGKVGHISEVDVDLENIFQAAAGRLQDSFQVLESLAGSILDGASDQSLGCRVDSDTAAAEDQPIICNGLGELRQRRRGCRGADDALAGHVGSESGGGGWGTSRGLEAKQCN